MKSAILYLCLLALVVSCGGKGDSGKAKFKLVMGNIISSPTSFTGGLIVMGRRLDGSQKFTLSLTTNLELDLQKGAWEFATIGWTAAVGGKKMTGPHICSYQQVELRDDLQTLTMNMNVNKCMAAQSLFGSEFADPMFVSLTNASGTIGFKKLVLIDCASIDITNGSCSPTSASSTLQSFKVIIPPKADGIVVNNAQELSECMNVSANTGIAYSDFQLPVGGKAGFTRMDLRFYTVANCVEGSATMFSYPHGVGEGQPGFSMLSPKFDALFGNTSIYYKGQWSAGGTITGTHYRGDLYEITTTSAEGISPGYFAYYTGSNWTTVITNEIYFSNGIVYFTDNNSYLYVKRN